jgi:hypothetical protein
MISYGPRRVPEVTDIAEAEVYGVRRTPKARFMLLITAGDYDHE